MFGKACVDHVRDLNTVFSSLGMILTFRESVIAEQQLSHLVSLVTREIKVVQQHKFQRTLVTTEHSWE